MIYLSTPYILLRNCNYIQKIFDDAEVEIDTQGVGWKCQPHSTHTVGQHRADGVLLVPYASMMAAGVARQCNDGEPRLEGSHLQTKLLSDALLNAWHFDVAKDVGHHAERQYLCQNPCWWLGI